MSDLIEQKTIWVEKDRVESLLKEINKLNKKALKYNSENPPAIQVTDEFRTVFVNHDYLPLDSEIVCKKVPVEEVKVIYTGQVPVINNWRFLAKIDHDTMAEAGRNIVTASSNVSKEDSAFMDENIDSYIKCASNCDHCKTNKTRNNTYILRNNNTGEVKQVGSTCIDEFLGDNSLAAVLTQFSAEGLLIKEEEPYDPEYFGAGGGFRRHTTSLEFYLAVAAYATEVHGFVTTKGGSDFAPSTLERVYQFLNPTKYNIPPQMIRAIAADANTEAPTNPYILKAKEVINWILEKEAKGNAYLTNSQTVAMAGFVVDRGPSKGLVCSWTNSYNKEKNEEHEKKQAASNGRVNEYFGNEKERGRLKLRFNRAIDRSDDDFPHVDLYFSDQSGRTFQWSCSGSAPELSVGKHYLLTGTIKGFYTSNKTGDKVTKLSRCNNIQDCEETEPVPTFLEEKKPKKKRQAENEPGM